MNKLLLLCMLLVVNYCKGHSGVTNLDFSRGFKNKEKHVSFCTAFLNNGGFSLNNGLYSGYFLIFSRRTTVPVFTRWHSTGRYS